MDNDFKDKNSKKWYKFIPGFGTKKRWRNVLATIFYLFSLSFIFAGELGISLFFLSIPFILLYGFKLIKGKFQNKPKNKTTKNLFLIAIALNIIGFIIIPTNGSNDNVNKPVVEKTSIEDQKKKDAPSKEERKKKEEEIQKELAESEKEKEETRKKRAEKKKREEEARKKEEEEKRIAEEKRKKEEEQKRADNQKQKIAKQNSSTNKKGTTNNTPTKSQNNSQSNSGGGNNKPPQIVETPTNQNYTYVANANTGKFHYTHCGSAKKMKESNRIYFHDRNTVINSGYSPCGRCNP